MERTLLYIGFFGDQINKENYSTCMVFSNRIVIKKIPNKSTIIQLYKHTCVHKIVIIQKLCERNHFNEIYYKI